MVGRLLKLLYLALPLLISGCTSIAVATPEASVDEMPSDGPVGRTMQRNSERFAACGRDSVTVQTGTVQRMKLQFSIDPEGKVTKAQILEMGDADPDLRSCVLRTLKRVSFPKPSDGKPKTIRYPLTLRGD